MVTRIWTLLLCTGLLLGLTSAGTASAKNSDNSMQSIATVRVSPFTGFPDTLGISAALTAFHPFELDMGISAMTSGSTWYVRAGAGIPLMNQRNMEGVGSTLHLPMLAGYRLLDDESLDVTRRFQGINAVAGLDWTYWTSQHFGLDVQLLLGANLWVSRPSENAASLSPDLRLAIGMAF